eukprot:TRINITY_DN11795_c0_g1_i7.p1 TRINITY_DN11795_c0_g1~~TRINITY_DN11795_c0_g1_i7.p1  ORF type:complete len:1026 (+),score=183.29 TRINITY_DN11795_c0_g1_i7:94-3171(+)
MLPLLYILSLLSCATSLSFINPHNNHTYILSDSPSYFEDIVSPSLQYSGGYLATITSPSEFDWILQTFGSLPQVTNDNSLYIGLGLSSAGTYSWLGGPEARYNVDAGTQADPRACKYFCRWNGIHPENNSGREHAYGIAWRDGATPGLDDFDGNYFSFHYLIEIGSESVVASVVPTSGGSTDILVLSTGPSNWDTLVQTTRDPARWQVTIGASSCNVTQVLENPPGLRCTAGPGTGGVHHVTVMHSVDGSTFSATSILQQPVFSYAPSQATHVSGYHQGAITIRGHNFGEDVSLVSAQLGSTLCTRVTMLVPHTVLLCHLDQEPLVLIPVIITVDGQRTETMDPLIYNPSNGHMYRKSPGIFSYHDARASSLLSPVPIYTAEGVEYERGYIATITNQAELDFLSRNYFNFNVYKYWIGAEDMMHTRVYRWGTGPQEGQIVYNYWTGSNYTIAKWIGGAPDYHNDSDGIDTAVLIDNGVHWADWPAEFVFAVLLEYGWDYPTISPIPADGGRVTLSGVAFGSLSLQHNITVGNYTCEDIEEVIPWESLSCVLPDGIGAHLPVVVRYLDEVLVNGTLRASFPARCGDNFCDPSQNETCITCPDDCGMCPVCGDQVCNGEETCSTCPEDCGPCPARCGDDICDRNANETCSTCPDDCGPCPARCGDGVCDPASNETCSTCPDDCGPCPARCGDGVCDPNAKETCFTCPDDCGVCAGVCGDHLCDLHLNETCTTCPEDCGVCPPPSCPGTPPCSDHGSCVEGTCHCTGAWGGEACLHPTLPLNVTVNGTETTIVTRVNSTTTSSYNIVVLEIQEIDQAGVTVASHKLNKPSLKVPPSHVHVFFHLAAIESRRMDVPSSLGASPVVEFVTNITHEPPSQLTVQLLTVTRPSKGKFGSHTFTLPANSIKCTFMISNYKFANTTNRLQLIVQQSTSTPRPPPSVPSSCQLVRTGANMQSSSPSSDEQMGRISIPSEDGSTLYAQFPNYLILDGREAVSRVNHMGGGLVGISVPHFQDDVIIDPNFSVILDHG